MNKIYRLNLIILLSFIVNALIFSQQINTPQKINNQFIPPLKIPPVVSGSFGELRTNHFHSGLDLTTSGRTGYPVYAIADGYISRIKVSPVGYGKALYIDHDNGYTSVYGHMEAYSKQIDSIVVARQYALKSYDFDWYPDRNKIRVKQGDIIGYSGNSGGSGGPHLHLEIRETSTQKPMNPLLFYSFINDNISPIIRRIRVYPITSTSVVNGKNSTQTYSVEETNGDYRLTSGSMIAVGGEIGIGIDAIDYLPGSRRNCGVYIVALDVNGKRIYESEVDKLNFAETRYINSLVDYAYKVDTKHTIQKSFVEPNNHLSIYNIRKNNGILNIVKDSVYQLKYTVQDINGNTSTLKFALKGTDEMAESSNPDDIIKWNTPFRLLNDIYRINIDASTFYTDVAFNVVESPVHKGDISERVKFGDERIPAHKPFKIELKVPDSLKIMASFLCMGTIDDKGEKSYAGGNYSNGWITCFTRQLGTYTILIDSVPPVIQLRHPKEGNNYSNSEFLELYVTDNFSGLDTYRCEVDGNWELFEYDYKTNRLICPLQKTRITKGNTHKLLVKVKDACGNAASKTFNFYY